MYPLLWLVVMPVPITPLQDGARSNKRLVAYAEAASAVAKEAGLPFVDLFHQMQVRRAVSCWPPR